MTLEEARKNIGRYVVYTPFEGCSDNQKEVGVITSVNDTYVFVRYGDELHSKATRPEDLKL
jgi:hypothetical protein